MFCGKEGLSRMGRADRDVERLSQGCGGHITGGRRYFRPELFIMIMSFSHSIPF